MAKFIHAERLRVAVERLRASRASGGMINFLILKRALVLDPDGVKFSSVDQKFQQAIDELTLRSSTETHARPFVNVLGSLKATNLGTIGPKYRSNGPGDTLRNSAWTRKVVDIGDGETSAIAKLKQGDYVSDLQRLTLVKDRRRPMPLIQDAAVWYYRNSAISKIIGRHTDPQKIEEGLVNRFRKDLRLTDDELAILFASEPVNDAE
jgi:hypothetical protein